MNGRVSVVLVKPGDRMPATGDVNDAAAAFKRTVWSLYGQDDWRVNDQLSFVLNPVVLPRLGFTYNLNDMGWLTHGKLQGGFGVFSGGDPLVWFGNAFQNNGFGFAEGTTSSANCPDNITVMANGQFTGLPECFRQDAIDKAALGLGDTQSIDPSIKMPTVRRANIGYQTQFEFNPSAFGRGWQLNLDYIFSHYKDPYGLVDLSQTPDIRKGLNGFTVDGRPIYAAIDPTVAGCDAQLVSAGAPPVWQNVTAACFATGRDDELMLTNTKGYNTHVFSAILSKNFDRGILTPGGSSYFTLGYAFTAANDRRNMFNSTAGSNFDLTAAFDRQNPGVSRSFYASRHNISFTGNFSEKFFDDLATSLGFIFVSRAGRPYSLTFAGGAVFNDSASGNDNALVYIPTGIDDPNISPLSNMTGGPAAVGLCPRPQLREEVRRQDDQAEHLRERLVQRPRPAPVAAAARSGKLVRLAARRARQDHRLCDVRKLPELPQRQVEPAASPQFRRPAGRRLARKRKGGRRHLHRRRRPGTLHHRRLQRRGFHRGRQFHQRVGLGLADQGRHQLRLLIAGLRPTIAALATMRAPQSFWHGICSNIADEIGIICRAAERKPRSSDAALSIIGQRPFGTGQKGVEARAGIEPACKDLQSSA